MLDLYASLYQTYRSLFQPRQAHSPAPGNSAPTRIDTEATLLGNAYRGSGVLIGILGALIIFCAVAPVGLGLLHESSAIYFGFAEVGLMAWVIQTLSFVKKHQIKERWIDARRSAELERYQPLQDALSHDMASLVAAVSPLLGGSNCQVAYNEERHHLYHAIEVAATKTTLFGFVISLVAAIAHLVIHANSLIFLTAALPAAVGALHGINAFLHLEELAEEHHQMSKALEALQQSFRQAVQSDDLAGARSIAENIHALLTQGHQSWISIATRLEVRAP
jgi:hypothetical protein